MHVKALKKAYHPHCWNSGSQKAETVTTATAETRAPEATKEAPKVDYGEVRRIVAAAIKEHTEQAEHTAQAHTIEVRRVDGTTIDVGRQHKQFPLLLQALMAGCNVWIAGEAGSGKTTAAEAAAKALGQPFSFDGAMDTEYKVIGFVDAQGRIVSTQFRRAWETGGLHLFDECDASLPGATLALNAALANKVAAFPDSMVPMNPSFRCIAAANTWGLGATFDYVGRNKLDAAFLDRFVQIPWEYDEGLEMAVAGNPEWTKFVQERRKRAKAAGLKVVISPRASIFGARLLASGMERDAVIDLTMRAKMRPEDWEALS